MSHASEVPAIDAMAELESLRQQNQALREELDETNQGVLALYAELDQQAEQLRDVSELKSRFLSYMSHEFRTPLGSILSITRLLEDGMDGPLNAEQLKQVRFVSASTRELSEMVDDLLDLAKIEAGRVTISPGWFDLMDLFAALRGMFRPLTDASRTTLIFEDPPVLPMLYTDDKKLAQILRNFISNALKFTPQGHVRVFAQLQGDTHVRFSVQDTGIGSRPNCTTRCSRISCRWIRHCRSASPAPAWACRSASALPSCWAAPWASTAWSGRARNFSWYCR